MIYKIEISAHAESDLRDIYEYIAFKLFSPKAAAAQLVRLKAGIISRDQMPKRFRAYQKEPWYSKGLRVMPVDKFLVFYIPSESDKKVYIIRVIYGGRNIEKELNSG